MVINIHAGHNPDGKVACGAVGLIKESTEARNVKNEVIQLLRKKSHTVFDCTVEDGTSQGDVLAKIVKQCNAHTADLDVSIHFNAGAYDTSGNGRTTGVEAYLYSLASKAREKAAKICENINALGYRNRGVKVNANLYVLKNTKAPAMIIECCFVDDKDDVELYNCQAMAKAIAEGIIGEKITGDPVSEAPVSDGEETAAGANETLYRVQCGAYSKKENAEAMKKKLLAAGFDCFITSA